MRYLCSGVSIEGGDADKSFVAQVAKEAEAEMARKKQKVYVVAVDVTLSNGVKLRLRMAN